MYEAFYGLSAGPFQLNPDAEFYFESAGHRRAYAYLQYGVAQGEGFVVVTGEVGAGKTTLVRALLTELDAQKVIAAQLVSTQLDADDLLRSVAIAFGLPGKASRKAELVNQIQKFLVDLVPSGRRALLVVDEAQNLTPDAVEELRALSSFQLDGRHLLQSFLVGQPELRKLMRAPSMRLTKWPLTPCKRSQPSLKATLWLFTTLINTANFPVKYSKNSTGCNIGLPPDFRSVSTAWRNTLAAFQGPREKTCAAKCGLLRKFG